MLWKGEKRERKKKRKGGLIAIIFVCRPEQHRGEGKK